MERVGEERDPHKGTPGLTEELTGFQKGENGHIQITRNKQGSDSQQQRERLGVSGASPEIR